MLSKVIHKAIRGQRLMRPFAGGSHGDKHHHDSHHHAPAGSHHDHHHDADHHDDHHGHHEVDPFDKIKLDLTKAYFKPTQEDLRYQTIFGLAPASGEHNLQPCTKFDVEEEYWYAIKDGKFT